MAYFTAVGWSIGGANCGSQDVNGVGTADSTTITGILSLIGIRDDTQVSFSGSPSSFTTIAVQADNGVLVQADLSTTTGSIFLDGDVEDSSTEDGFGFPNQPEPINTITLADGRVVSARELLTLEATRGAIVPAGTLTLMAGSGIVIHNEMNGMVSGSALVINSDYDSHGDGILTIATNRTVYSNEGPISITAWDVDLQGYLNSGIDVVLSSGTIAFHGSQVDQTLSLGSVLNGPTAKDMHIHLAELDRITAVGGLSLGSDYTGTVTVDGIDALSSDTTATIQLVATKGGMRVEFAGSDSLFDKGIIVQGMGGVILSSSVMTNNTATVLSGGTGTLTVAAAKSMSTYGEPLVIIVDDIDLVGNIKTDRPDVSTIDRSTFATASQYTAHASLECYTAGRTVGLGTASAQLMLSNDELALMTGFGLQIGGANCGNQIVSGVTSAASNGIAEVISLMAIRDDASVSFVAASSTFSILSVTTDDGMNIQVDVRTIGGPFFLDGDSDHASSTDATTGGKLVIGDGKTLSAKTYLTLQSFTGSVAPVGALTLQAGAGIIFSTDLTALSSGLSMVFNTDYESVGDGTLTVMGSRAIDSSNGPIQITSWDLCVDGSITSGTNAGSSTLFIHGSSSAQTLSLGETLKDMQISDDELGRLTSVGGMKLGSSTSGDITVTGVSDGHTDTIGTLTLVGTKSATTVTFLSTASSFNKGIVVQGMGGVVFSESATTRAGSSVLYAGTGSLTVVTAMSMQTSGQLLTITTDDFDVNGEISSGAAVTIIECTSDGRTVGLGAGAGQLSIIADELTYFTALGMTIGGSKCGSQIVNGVGQTNSVTITAILTLLSIRDDAHTTFSGVASTFNAMSVQADNGVIVQADVTTVLGLLYVDGDVEDSSTTDGFETGFNAVSFTTGRTVSAKTIMTMEATVGDLKAAGTLSLIAGAGMVLSDSLTAQAAGNAIVLNSDQESTGDGTLTITGTKAVTSSDALVTITAWDLALDGEIVTGTSSTASLLTIHAAHAAQTIGLGSTSKDMHISDVELGSITSVGGLELGSSHSGTITVDGTTDGNSDTIGTLSLVANSAAVLVSFATTASSFNKGIIVQAMGGITLLESVTTRAGATVMQAGTGTITVAATMSLSTTDQLLNLTSDDMDLSGEVISGTGAITLECTTNAQNVGVGTYDFATYFGANTAQLYLEGSELGMFTCGGMIIGGDKCGDITVANVVDADSTSISGVLTFVASRDDHQVLFRGASSTFTVLSTQADNGVVVMVDLTTTGGSLYLDADVEDSSSSDTINSLRFTDGQTVTSHALLTLEATHGMIEPAASASLIAGSGIVILDDFTASSTNTILVIDSDMDDTGDGTLTVWTGKTVELIDSELIITAWDIDLLGGMFLQQRPMSIHGAVAGQTLGLGSTAKDLQITDDELGRMKTNSYTIGSSLSGSIMVDGITPSNSDTIGTLTLLATGPAKTVNFDTAMSNFTQGVIIQAMGGVVVDATMIAGGANIDTGTGTLTVKFTKSLSTTNQLLSITADDMDLLGIVSSGTASVNIECRTAGRTVGLGNGAGAFSMTLAVFYANGMTIGGSNCASQVVDGVTNLASENIDGIITLLAIRDASTVTFSGASSTFNGVAALADDGIVTQVHLTTTGGYLYLDGDNDNDDTGDTNVGKIVYSASRILTSKTQMTLETTTGTMENYAALTLFAGTGITIQDDIGMHVSAINGNELVINSDSEIHGDGALTVAGGQTITTKNGAITVTAWDLDLAGAFDVGTASVKIFGSKVDQTIGLGASNDMHIVGSELQRITSEGGLQVGSSYTGSIIIRGLLESETSDIGTLNLVATKQGMDVRFKVQASSFNKGIVVQAMGGIAFSEGATMVASPTVLFAGTGAITIKSGAHIITTNQKLEMTTDDLDMSGAISSGIATTILKCTSDGRTIGIGAGAGQMSITASEFAHFTAGGMVIGDAQCGSQVVNGILEADSNSVSATLTLFAIRDDAHATFEGTSSTFNSISVQADDGITLQTHLSATGLNLYLDGDYDNIASSDATHGGKITLPDGKTLKAEKVMTLETSSGEIEAAGELSLIAGSGLVIWDSLTITSVSKSLTLNSDFDSHGNGILTIAVTSDVATTNSDIKVTAWDFELAGTLVAGTATMEVHGAKSLQTVGLGATSQDMHITDAEIGRITAEGSLTVGSSITGSAIIVGMTESNTATIGTMKLMANANGQTATFMTTASSFNKGIIVQASGGLVLGESVTTKSSPTVFSCGDFLAIQTDRTLSTTNQHLTVIADDMNFASAGIIIDQATMAIDCITEGRLVALGSATWGAPTSLIEFSYNAGEMSRTTAGGLVVGGPTCGSQAVAEITVDDSQYISGIITLSAVRDAASVTFRDATSTFYGVAVQADDGIFLYKDVISTVAHIYFDADIEDSPLGADASNMVEFVTNPDVGRLMQAKTVMTLESSTGDMKFSGATTLAASEGIIVHDNLIGFNTGHNLVINADFEVQGDGTLTVATGKTIHSNAGNLLITGWDMDLSGNLKSGNAEISIHGSQAAQTIGLGQTAKDMQITDAELGGVTTVGGLTIGSQHSGDMFVTSITNDNSDSLSTLTLVSTAADKVIRFDTVSSSFNKGITVQTAGGVLVSANVTAMASASVINAGLGSLTIALHNSFSSTDQLLTITADDFDVAGHITSGGHTTMIECTSPGRTVALGAGAGQLSINADEFMYFTATGLSIGGGNCGSQNVNGILEHHGSKVAEVLTLYALRDDTSVTFDTVSSTFSVLSVQADDGIIQQVDVTASSGNVYFDGDLDNSNADDATNSGKITFAAGTALTAKEMMTMEATSGVMEAAGPLTFAAGSGMYIWNHITGTASGNAIVLTADYESGGDGTLTIASSMFVTTNDGDLSITAWDVHLAGGIISGTSAMSIHGSTSGQTVSIGTTVKDMHLSSGELAMITTTGGLRVGGTSGGSISVSGVVSADSNTISPVMSLMALADGSLIHFFGTASTFNAVSAISDDGVRVDMDVDATSGVLYMDGDFEDSTTGDAYNRVRFAAGRTVKAATLLTLEATTGLTTIDAVSSFITAAGSLSLIAGAGVYIWNDILGMPGEQPLVINADYDSGGDGTLTVAVSMTLITNDGDVTITAWDLDLAGGITAGQHPLSVHGSLAGHTMGLGDTSKDMHLTGAEISRLTASGGVRFGGSDGGALTVDGVTDDNSENIGQVITIAALNDGASVSFINTGSSFHAIVAQADNGVQALATIIATAGLMYLDGDYEDSSSDDDNSNTKFGDGVTAQSGTLLTLEASTGVLVGAGATTLRANSGVVILDNYNVEVSGNKPLTIHANIYADQSGTLTITTAKEVLSNNSDIVISAWDVDFQGAIGSGTASTTVIPSYASQTVGLGNSGKNLHLSDAELSRISTVAGLQVGYNDNGNIAVNGVQDASTTTLGTITLVATKVDKLVTFEIGASAFNKGVIIQAGAGVVLYQSLTTKASADIINAGTGTLTISTARSLSTTNQLLTITANDIDMVGSGTLDVGPAATAEVHCTSPNRQIGLGSGTGQLRIDSSEIQRITAGGMTIGNPTCWSIFIENADFGNVADIVTLRANRDNAQVTFMSAASTFSSLNVQADNGVVLKVDVTSTSGEIYLDADIENSSSEDGLNAVSFEGTRTIQTKLLMTLESTHGNIVKENELTLIAGSGIVIHNDMNAKKVGRLLVLNADFDSANDGTLTISGSRTVDTNSSPILITAWDLDIQGNINAGASSTTVHGSLASQTIGVGDTAQDMHIADAEIDRISSAGGLELGSSTGGSIAVDGITETGSDTVGTITLNALTQQVIFDTAISDFNKGIIIQAGSGVIIKESITTKASASVVYAGANAFTIESGKSIVTTDQHLTITADDLVYHVGKISAGNAAIQIECATAGRTVGVGTGAGDFSINAAEMTRTTSAGLVLGGPQCGSQVIEAILRANSNGIEGVVTLVASKQLASVTFSAAPSTFYGLAAQADDGVFLQVDITTTESYLSLDGDIEDDSVNDISNKVTFAVDVTVLSKTSMTLESTTGHMENAGALSLIAGSGISVFNNILGIAAGNAIVLNADYESHGDGTITVAATRTITSNDGDITVTAWDVDLLGGFDTASSTLSIHGSKIGQTLGVGNANPNTHMHITDGELSRMTATEGLRFADDAGGSITVDGVLSASSQYLYPVVSFVAAAHGATVTFEGEASTFSALAAQADDGVYLRVDVEGTAGILYIDGDLENSSTEDTGNVVYIQALKTLKAKTNLTLEASTGSIIAGGALTLFAGSGMYIWDALGCEFITKTFVLNADYDSHGDGTLTVAATKFVSSNDGAMTITAWDIDIPGGVTAGVGAMSVHGSKDGQTIGFGVTAKDMHISGSEMQRMTGLGGVRMGGTLGGSITVNGILKDESDFLGPVVSLVALADTATVSFITASSTFNAVTAQADDGIIANVNVDGTSGLLYFDGNADNVDNNNIELGDLISLSAKTMMTIESSGGTILHAGGLTFTAGSGIYIWDHFKGTSDGTGIAKEVVMCADYDSHGDGTLTISTGKTIETNNAPIQVTAWDIDFQGTTSANDRTFEIHGSKSGQTIGLGSTSKDMHISDVELATLTSRDGLTVGSSDNGSMWVNAITKASSDEIGTLTLRATGVGSSIIFRYGISSFNKGITVQAGYGVVLSETAHSQSSPTVVSTGSGTLTIANTIFLKTTGQSLTITADDIDLKGTAVISSGTSEITMNCFTGGRTVGLGTGMGQLSISNEELAAVYSGGFILGGPQCGTQTIRDLTTESSNLIQGTMTFLANRDDAQVVIWGLASSFSVLSAQADNGVYIKADVTSTLGSIYLDGDIENSSSADGFNQIGFTDGVTMKAKELMTLRANTGNVLASGTLTLFSGSGMIFEDDMLGATNKAIVINSDFESGGDGTMTIVTNRGIITQDGDVTMTVWDLDLSGTINTAGGAVTVHGSQASQTIGLGDTSYLPLDNTVHYIESLQLDGGGIHADFPTGVYNTYNNMHITDVELSRVTNTGGFTVGSSISGTFRVDGVTNDNSGSCGTITLVAGRVNKYVAFLSKTSTFNKGIIVRGRGGVVIDQDVTSWASSTVMESGEGSLTITAHKTLSTNNQLLRFIADDTDLQGRIVTGTNAVTAVCYSIGWSVGLGVPGLGQLQFTDAEFSRISSVGMTIGGSYEEHGGLQDHCSSTIVKGLTGTGNVTGMVTLLSNRDDANILFTDIASTFSGLAVQADNGVYVKADLTTLLASVWLDGDVENSSTGDTTGTGIHWSDRFTTNRTVTAKQRMTLEATTGAIVPEGTLTLKAGTGIMFVDNLLGASQGSQLVLNADWDAGSDGTFTVISGRILNTNEASVQITAWDIDMSGTILTGTEAISLHGAYTEQSIGVGQTAQDMHLTGPELARLTSTSLTVGSSLSGSMLVHNITDVDTGTVGTITLAALRANTLSTTDSTRGVNKNLIIFDNSASSFNKGIIVHAQGGVMFSESLTTKGGLTNIHVGTRKSLWVEPSKSLITSDQLLVITADDIRMLGSVNSGNGAIHMECETPGRSLELGAGTFSSQWDYNAAEIGRTTANGLVIGGPICGLQIVGDIPASSSAAISGIVTLFAPRDNAKVTFFSAGTTFNALHAQADNGVVFLADLSTSGAEVYLNGDLENSSSDDGDAQEGSAIAATDSRTITAATVMTLQAETSLIFMEGTLSFVAGAGMIILDSVVSVDGNDDLVLNADYDLSGDGTLTLQTAETIDSNNGHITVTAWDLDLAGGMTSRDKNIYIHPSKEGETVGIGDVSRDMHISNAELTRISTVGGLLVGSSTNGKMEVKGINEISSGNCGTLTLIATRNHTSINFIETPSSFNKGITVRAGAGIILEHNVATRAGASLLSAGAGALTIYTPRILNTHGQRLQITADDLTLQGFIDTTQGPGNAVEIDCGVGGQSVGLGAAVGQLTIEGDELSKITAGGIAIGGSNCGQTTVTGVLGQHSAGITGIMTIAARYDNAQVTFDILPSTFNELSAIGDNGVIIKVPVTTDTAGFYLDGDAEDSAVGDNVNNVVLADGLRFTAKTLVTLESTTGLIVPQGALTMEAGMGMQILGDLVCERFGIPLVLNADFELVGDGTFTVGQGKTITSNNSEVTVTGWDVDLAGSIHTGNSTLNIHVSKEGQTIGLGEANVTTPEINVTWDTYYNYSGPYWNSSSNTSYNMTHPWSVNTNYSYNLTTYAQMDMHIDSMELQHISSHGGVTIGGSFEGDVTISGVTENGTMNMFVDNEFGPIFTLMALGDDSQITFFGHTSTFSSLAARADNGVLIKVDVATASGMFFLDGDAEDSSSQDGVNTVGFTDGVSVFSKTMLTLESTTGIIVPDGRLTLKAGGGLLFANDLVGARKARWGGDNLLTINADYESAGDGTFTVAATKLVNSNDSDMIITAWDVDLLGYMTSGTMGVQFHGALAGQTVGIGNVPGDMHISGIEMQKVTCVGGLRLGGGSCNRKSIC